MKRRVIAVSLLLLGGQMARADVQPDDSVIWERGIAVWRAERARSIGGEEGWMALVARALLKPGENRVGAAKGNDVVLPHAPKRIGSVFVEGDKLRFVVAPGVKVTVDDKPVSGEVAIVDDRDGKQTMLRLGPLVFHVIKRGDTFALRVKDKQSPARKKWKGLSYYPLDRSLRVTAHLDPAPAGKKLAIVNVLDQIEQMDCPGTLRFSIGGVAYSLDAIRETGEDELFILFKDGTAGNGTYPSGRFLHAPLPDARGNVDLDFNRAYTPPCGFTNFATCPIPPKQNRLPRKIEAGEKYRGHDIPPQ